MYRNEILCIDKDDGSSNFKELDKLVRILKEVRKGEDRLWRVELFLLADNNNCRQCHRNHQRKNKTHHRYQRRRAHALLSSSIPTHK